MVGVTANLGDTTTFSATSRSEVPSAYFTRRIRAPLRRAQLDWIATAERPLALVPKSPSYNAAQYRGLRFERRVTEAIAERYGAGWLPQPVFRFLTAGYSSRAVPDGILYSPEEILVVEIKYNYRREDLGQLEEFYLPIVRKAFPRHFVGGLFACQNLLEPQGLKSFQVLSGSGDLDTLRARRFTQYLLIGKGVVPLRRGRYC